MLLRQILSTRPADRPDADAILAQLELWSTQGFAGSKAKPSQSDEAAPRAVHPAVPQKNGSWTTGWETDMWEDGRSPVTDVDGVQQRLDSSASAASATSSSGPSIRAAADSNALSVAQPLEASFGKSCLAGQSMISLKKSEPNCLLQPGPTKRLQEQNAIFHMCNAASMLKMQGCCRCTSRSSSLGISYQGAFCEHN